MRFVTFEEASAYLRGKRVAIVGSGPSSLANVPGFVDSHDVVVRVNNYKVGDAQGWRADVHYAFYGSSITKDKTDLQRDGVKLCWAKCPDAKCIDSEWHASHGKLNGVDFRYIYRAREGWWFCDTFVPGVTMFLEKFELLDRHIPTTGFAAILDVLACEPKSTYLTGFDFFSSGIHNVDEKWKPGDPADPIGHRPDLESNWIKENRDHYPLSFDRKLRALMA